ncbi:Fc.00g077490.m01.CDS01 [Cosmosporella sp. VM-42]
MDIDESVAQPMEEHPVAFLHHVDTRSMHQSQLLLPIRDQDIFKVGRDPRSNTFTVENDPDYMVSRNHCEFYVVVYEPTINHVYVRDRKSYNGTHVNGVLVGRGPRLSPGYLLQHGDVVEIRPHWKFTFVQEHSPPRHDLTNLQLEECKEFAHKYSLTDRCLGQGAEAIVYLAVERLTRKQLVCKLVNLDRIQSKATHGTVQSKLQETDILRQLRHPNILPYIDAVISPHSLYTFTELASGGDLMSFLNRHEFVKEFNSRIITRQIVHGLRYLHEKGIVHRDLKPENVLLAYSPRLAYHRIMLSDFGNSAVSRRNRMVTNVGTMSYQAPEFQSGTQVHTSVVDIWSLGVVVLLLVASGSDVSFEGINRMSQREIGKFLKVVFSRLIKHPSSNAKNFIWTCLQTMPSERMDAIQVQRHDWLCKPERHLKFFRELDRRMMADWDYQTELSPMPWEIRSLKKNSPVAEMESEHLASQYFTAAPEDQARLAPGLLQGPYSVPQPEEAIADLDAEASLTSLTSENEPSSDQADRSASAKAEVKTKQSQHLWKGFTTPSPIKFVKPESRPKRKRSIKIKVNDAALLPLTNLERHLRPAPGNRHREQVLAELKTSNRKFIVEPSPILPMTPPRMVLSQQAPPTPKRQKNKRNVFIQASDLRTLVPQPSLR